MAIADGKTYRIGTARNIKQQQIKAELEAHPEKSNRQIGRELGVSDNTVSAQRERCSGGQLAHLNTLDNDDKQERTTPYNPEQRE